MTLEELCASFCKTYEISGNHRGKNIIKTALRIFRKSDHNTRLSLFSNYESRFLTTLTIQEQAILITYCIRIMIKDREL